MANMACWTIPVRLDEHSSTSQPAKDKYCQGQAIGDQRKSDLRDVEGPPKPSGNDFPSLVSLLDGWVCSASLQFSQDNDQFNLRKVHFWNYTHESQLDVQHNLLPSITYSTSLLLSECGDLVTFRILWIDDTALERHLGIWKPKLQGQC